MKKYFLIMIIILCNMASNDCFASQKSEILDYHYREDRIEELRIYNKNDLQWLARNIYFEARSEDLEGRTAIAIVTLNRVLDRRWPSTIEGVVTDRKQFSWYNSGTIPAIKDMTAWKNAKTLAFFCLALYNSMAASGVEDFDQVTLGANHYHTTYIKTPKWANRMEFLCRIGKHLLYKS